MVIHLNTEQVRRCFTSAISVTISQKIYIFNSEKNYVMCIIKLDIFFNSFGLRIKKIVIIMWIMFYFYLLKYPTISYFEQFIIDFIVPGLLCVL